MDRSRKAMNVSCVTIVGNVLLAGFKLFAGIFAHSSAMVSDAVHSLSDVMSTFVVIMGVKFSSKAADREHPYGHERIECIAALLLAVMLALTGLGIGAAGIRILIEQDENRFEMPGMLALIAAVVSILVKEAMYWYTRHAALTLKAGVLMADAWHHRSDALSSVGSLIGIIGARCGFAFLDPLASILICFFVLKAAYSIFWDAVRNMLDTACDDGTIEQIEKVIDSQPGVLQIDQLKSRLFGDRIYVDVEIQVDGNLSLIEAHNIAHHVHDAVEGDIESIKHCMVHVNPK
ncbi:MAG: cation transporter [Clostridiales bacterium]|nr:cation transporter [Clostridiales bacterium]